MTSNIIIRNTICFLNKQIVDTIESILIANGKSANLVEKSSCCPVIDCPSESEVCTIDRVYLEWDMKHENCEAMVDYSNSYMNNWTYVKNLPIETALDILGCLEEEDVWEEDENE